MQCSAPTSCYDRCQIHARGSTQGESHGHPCLLAYPMENQMEKNMKNEMETRVTIGAI